MNFVDNYNTNNYGIYFKAKPIPKEIIDNTTRKLLNKKVKDVDIYCHSSADEDTINSAKVFANWLILNGKKVSICIPKSETKDLYFDARKYNIKDKTKPADKTVILDFNSSERLSGLYKDLFYRIRSKDIIGYDHHSPNENTLKGKIYIDDTAKSCCGVLTRFFEGLGITLSKQDRKSLYCGMISDYKKSGLIKIHNKDGIYSLEKTEKLLTDKNSLEVFNKLDESLTTREKNTIYKHLDPLSRLTAKEKELQKWVYENINVTRNGKMAFVIIPPHDELWKKVGMDTTTTSDILKDLRVKLIEHRFDELPLSDKQKKRLKNVNTAIVFYRKTNIANDEYRMSIHSSSNSALDIISKAKEYNPNITAGGHADRAGGKIDSISKEKVAKFISAFTKSADIL